MCAAAASPASAKAAAVASMQALGAQVSADLDRLKALEAKIATNPSDPANAQILVEMRTLAARIECAKVAVDTSATAVTTAHAELTGKICSKCKTVVGDTSAVRCNTAGCKAMYCGSVHRAEDWKAHKKVCPLKK